MSFVESLSSLTHFFDAITFQGFSQIIYQAVLFTILFYIFSAFFSRYVFRNKQYAQPSFIRIGGTFIGFIIYIWLLRCFVGPNIISGSHIDSVKKVDTVSVAVAGQQFAAPELVKAQKPLNAHLDFACNECCEGVITTIKTDLAEYGFSSRGAVLNFMNFAWQGNTKHVSMLPVGSQCFLLGCGGVTPMTYELVNVVEYDDKIEIQYRVSYDLGILEKTFVVYKKSYQLDVRVLFTPINQQNVESLRLFFGMPILVDDLKGIVNVPDKQTTISLQEILLTKEDTFKQFWFEPKIFGLSQKFLTQICYNSTASALLRAFFQKIGVGQYQVIFESHPLQGTTLLTWSFYMGPKTVKAMNQVAPCLSETMKYGWFNFIAKPMFSVLVYLKERCGNYGWAIILLTLLLKLLLLPFTLKGEKSLKKQAEFEKKRLYLQQKFKNDRAALDQAQAELMQKQGASMLSGCLPMLLNIPVFIALNAVLVTTIELHGASFYWIHDLSIADPYYLLSIAMFLGMALVPNPKQGPRQLVSRLGMALLVSAFTAYLSSGLVLFIAVNAWLSVMQTYAVYNIPWLNRCLD